MVGTAAMATHFTDNDNHETRGHLPSYTGSQQTCRDTSFQERQLQTREKRNIAFTCQSVRANDSHH